MLGRFTVGFLQVNSMMNMICIFDGESIFRRYWTRATPLNTTLYFIMNIPTAIDTIFEYYYSACQLVFVMFDYTFIRVLQ